MNLSSLAQLAAHSGGILYLMPLLLLVVLTVGIERFLLLNRIAREGRRVSHEVAEMGELDLKRITGLAQGAGFPFRALLEVPARFPRVRDSARLSELLQEAVMRQVPSLDKRLWLLDTIVTLAPLLGLLGTIIGMFHAFQFLDNAAGNPTAITGSVGEALIATAAGLVIAMIGLVAFNGLHNRMRFLVHQMETLRTMLVNRLEGLEHQHALVANQAQPLLYSPES